MPLHKQIISIFAAEKQRDTIMDKTGLSYNTEKKKIIIAEYGRNIQEMIQHLTDIEDRQKRTEAANFIISVMEQMNPQVKESGDYIHKLWDHLFIISDFKLDVDSPFEPPIVEEQVTKPHHIDYHNDNIRYGHYGQYVIKAIEVASETSDPATRDALAYSIANQMKRDYIEWNRVMISDQVILDDLKNISNGRLTLTEDTKLVATGEIVGKTASQQTRQQLPGKKKKKKVAMTKANLNNPNSPVYKKKH